MNSVSPTPFADAADTWNRRFEAEPYLFGTEPNTWLREHADAWQPGQRVLCVADGEGRNSCLLYTSPSPRDGLLSRMPSSA